MGSLEHPKIPIIDFSETSLRISWSSTRDAVVRALEDCGCFVALYDKVCNELHDEIFGVSEELFDHPVETKILNVSETPNHGYVGNMSLIPLYEGLSIENATTLEGAKRFTDIFWPSGNQRVCETTLSFSKLVAELDQTVMKMVSENYGIEREYESLSESMTYLLRFIKYRGPEPEETDMGIVPHTDKSFTSILHQRQVKGLEVKTSAGEWVPLEPLPSSFVFMAGDVCMAWTNGRVKSPQHRVKIEGERYSMGLFSFIRDLTIETPKELIDTNHPLTFKPFQHYKFLHFYASSEGRKSKSAIKSYCGV